MTVGCKHKCKKAMRPAVFDQLATHVAGNVGPVLWGALALCPLCSHQAIRVLLCVVCSIHSL